MKTTVFKQFSLNAKDLLKGFLMAAIMAVVATCGQILDIWLTSPTFSFDKISVILIIKAAIGGGVAYLFKNFIQPTQTVVKGNQAEVLNKID